MNTDHDLRRLVTDVLANEAPSGIPDEMLGRVLSNTSRTRPRPAWLADLKEPPMRIPARVTVGSPTFRFATIAALSLALILAAAGAVLAAASLLPGPDAAVILTLVTPEQAGRPSDAFITAFKAAVEQRSEGALTVDIRYPSGGADPSGSVGAVAQQVIDGKADLAVVPSWAWDDLGVTSFQALSAPFLIDEDGLAVAVATDPLTQPMLDGVGTLGSVGLTLWPEDLRHPFAFEQNGGPLLSPGDYSGVRVATSASRLHDDIIAALGATPVPISGVPDMTAADPLGGAESGLWQDAYELPGSPTATGDVTLFTSFQVLVANGAALDALPAVQQAVVRDAAMDAQTSYLAARPNDVANGAAYCASGGAIVWAGPTAREALVAAEAPIYERLAQDPLTATAIEAIRALQHHRAADRSIAPGHPASLCTPTRDAAATIAPVEAGSAIGPMPDGRYVQTLTSEALVARGADSVSAFDSQGSWTLTVDGRTGAASLRHHGGNPYEEGDLDVCPVTYSQPQVDRVRMTFGDGCGPTWLDVRWRVDGDRLRLDVLDEASGLARDLRVDAAIFGGPWTTSS